MDDRKHNPSEQTQARKLMGFFAAFAGMGQFAAMFSPWRPAKFVATRSLTPVRVPLLDRLTAVKPRGPSPEHVAAVDAMRAARRAKRIAKAQRLLTAKRRRQHAQALRHAKRVLREAKHCLYFERNR